MNVLAVQRFFVHHRVRVSFFIFFALMAEWLRHANPHPILSLQDFECPTGALLAIAGALLRSWAAGIIQKGTVLTVQGPYALTRHPLYLGSFMIMIGFSLAIEDNVALVAVAAVIAFIYIPTLRNEERALGARFGDQWRAYAANTGLLFPKRWPRLTAEWQWQRWWHHREYRALATVLLALALLEGWNVTTAG